MKKHLILITLIIAVMMIIGGNIWFAVKLGRSMKLDKEIEKNASGSLQLQK